MPDALPTFQAYALPNIPLVQAGDDVSSLILSALSAGNLMLRDSDVLVIASKIVSKAEGRVVRLADVVPDAEAQTYAEKTGKDPRIVALVLQESNEVSRARRGVLVTEHKLGFVSANAGIDQSNVENADEQVLLLPTNPDAAAREIREDLQEATGATCAVVISDTHGRPFRMGNIGVALGVAGMQALVDLRGREDLYGRKLAISLQAYADMIASAAHLLSGEAGEGRPVILLRGLVLPQGDGKASDLYRPREQDMYR